MRSQGRKLQPGEDKPNSLLLAYVLTWAAGGQEEDAAQTERIVRLFRIGRNQVLRIPRDLELPGNEALLYKEGSRLIVEPAQRPSLLELMASWEPLDEEFPDIDDDLPPLKEVDL